jgi:nucleotide-binding universal stress UspA family protein
VGSRGHGGFTAALLGSVTMQCVLHAHCSVLVFRDGTQAAAGGGP